MAINIPPIKPLCNHLVCKDGTTVSLQASQYHYSHPREDVGPYTAIEAGFPSMRPPVSWEPYAESSGSIDEDGNWKSDTEPRWTDTVYAYVPVVAVLEFIAEHGGVAYGQTPPMLMGSGQVWQYDIPAPPPPTPSKAFKPIQPSGSPLERL